MLRWPIILALSLTSLGAFMTPAFANPVFEKPIFEKPILFANPIFANPIFSKPMDGGVAAIVTYHHGGDGNVRDRRTGGPRLPTIIYGLLAAILGGGLLFGRSFIAIMFDRMFNLTPQGWRILTMRWAVFFFAVAILNEIIWRTQTTDFWVAFKALGLIPLTVGFAITQMPLTRRYRLEPASLEATEAEAGDVTKGRTASVVRLPLSRSQ